MTRPIKGEEPTGESLRELIKRHLARDPVIDETRTALEAMKRARLLRDGASSSIRRGRYVSLDALLRLTRE
jgi:hypothetical protein